MCTVAPPGYCILLLPSTPCRAQKDAYFWILSRLSIVYGPRQAPNKRLGRRGCDGASAPLIKLVGQIGGEVGDTSVAHRRPHLGRVVHGGRAGHPHSDHFVLRSEPLDQLGGDDIRVGVEVDAVKSVLNAVTRRLPGLLRRVRVPAGRDSIDGRRRWWWGRWAMGQRKSRRSEAWRGLGRRTLSAATHA